MTESSDLPLAEAVPLAHALVSCIAQDIEARVLFIKGPVSEHHGLRSPRPSTDVDVLVDPGDRQRILRELNKYGWTPRDVASEPRILEWHSVTLCHPEWPCDIDVHHTYPGLLADSCGVFEFLWSRRATAEIAGLPLPVAGRVEAACIVALHALRDMQVSRNGREYQYLVDQLLPMSDADREELIDFVTVSRSMDTLGRLLTDLAVPTPPRPASRDYTSQLREWELRVTDNSPTSRWISAIQKSSWRAKPGVIIDALFLPGDMLDKRHHVPAGQFGRARARVQRFQRGLRALGPSVRERIAIATGKRDPR